MRSHSKAFFAVAALLAFLLVPSSAIAGKPVNDFFGTIGNGNGQFSQFVAGLAVNQSTGDLYVFDQLNGRVQRFDEEGTYLSQFGEEGEGDGQFAIGGIFRGLGGVLPVPQIAIDQSDGSVYVADHANDRIQKFKADGTFVSVIETAAGSPVSEALSGPKGVAVGPDGTLYVADTGNNRIVKFDSTGAYLSDLSIPVGNGEGEMSSPVGLAVDSTGAIYIHEAPELDGRVQKFSAAGSFEYALSAGEALTAVATDVTNNHVFVAGRNDIYEFDASGALQDTHHVDPSGAVLNAFTGLAVNDADGPIYGANLNGTSQDGTWILILEEPGLPVPSSTIDPVTTLDSDSASFSGEVNPNGNGAANWRFQISSDGGESWSNVGLGGTVPEGMVAEGVAAEATGLEPSIEYQVRLVASKFFVSGQGVDSTSFITDAVAPVVEALDPGPVTDTAAWLGAYVNPRNTPTTFYVEYSTDPNFASSSSVPASEDASAGSGGQLTLANQLVTGLQPQTTYYYRVIATNEAGTTVGGSRSFTTGATPTGPPATGLPDDRVWEKVSPNNKAGANINAGNYMNAGIVRERSQAATNGDAVTFGSPGKFAGAEGAPAQSQYLARRGANGWSTEAINPPMEPSLGLLGNNNYFKWFSSDLSKGVVTTPAAINPGDPQGVYNLYLRDNNSRSYTTISDADDSTEKGLMSDIWEVSADEKHFIYQTSDTSLLASILMERDLTTGGVRQVSVLPDGSIVPAKLGSGEGGYMRGFNSVSADGSRIFFSARDGTLFESVYVRENGTSTELLSGSERTGDDPDAPVEGEFVGASRDGSVAFFRSAKRLTDDTPALESQTCSQGGTCYLYRWDAEEPAGQRLTNISLGDPTGPRVLGLVGLSNDGTSVYFAAYGNLDGNGSPKEPNLYLWRSGEGVRFVARLVDRHQARESDWSLWSRGLVEIEVDHHSLGDNDEPYKGARVTPDGRYLAFSSRVAQTAYDTDGKRAIYIYDSETARISCISCGAVSTKSRGHSWFVSCGAEDDGGETRCSATPYLVHNFRPDGKRLIFDSRDALVPQDTNGVTDVYEWQAGELHLLSSGTSAFPSRFVDASEDGDDVFFTTAQRLTPSDRDELRDLYDARVGGVPEPNVTPPCVADECQGTPVPPPSFQTPSSAGFKGNGNASQGRPRCGKAKMRRNGRCVKRKAKKRANGARNRRANQDRRAGR